ncbi:MAG: FprA family A-type flavoprotein, partial [Methanomicrobiales archaeon]|nr:FprA family A-type flavoprotein [Methanomicrobiales archaeon]
MPAREIVPDVYAVGVIDWDRTLFDELIPLPDGTTYNAYLIRGTDKTALVDTVDPAKEEELVINLVRLGIGRIDYIVVNHAEQDHSGSLPMILELFPMATIVTSEKCSGLLQSLLMVPPSRMKVVADGETLDLGGKTLEFLHAPWVHWPETMLTYLREDGILFSCDLFGAHYATSDLFADERLVYEPAKRYYAEIMMPFRASIRGYLDRLASYAITTIAPSHGPLHGRPAFIIDAYRDWTSDAVKNEAVVLYVSMHGSTSQMVARLTDALIDRGITVRRFNIAVADLGKIAMALVDAATIVIATPTVLFGPHPKMVAVSYIAGILKPKARNAAIIGSYGWGGKTVKVISDMLANLHCDMLDPVYIQGQADEEALVRLDTLADEI